MLRSERPRFVTPRRLIGATLIAIALPSNPSATGAATLAAVQATGTATNTGVGTGDTVIYTRYERPRFQTPRRTVGVYQFSGPKISEATNRVASGGALLPSYTATSTATNTPLPGVTPYGGNPRFVFQARETATRVRQVQTAIYQFAGDIELPSLIIGTAAINAPLITVNGAATQEAGSRTGNGAGILPAYGATGTAENVPPQRFANGNAILPALTATGTAVGPGLARVADGAATLGAVTVEATGVNIGPPRTAVGNATLPALVASGRVGRLADTGGEGGIPPYFRFLLML